MEVLKNGLENLIPNGTFEYAQRAGLDAPNRPGESSRNQNTHQNVLNKLKELAKLGDGSFPTRKQFIDNNMLGTYNHIIASKNGGIEKWAEEAGLPLG